MAKNNFFAEQGYEMQNAWEATGNEQKLSENKELMANIVSARVKETKLSDGNVIRNVVFFLKAGKPKSFKLSPYNEQFSAGTKIDVSSCVIGEYTNNEGELAYTITCDEL